MSVKALPILFINLSGEMMYILDQRLRAQNISQEKSEKVMHDIVKTMFAEQFIEELFKPQELYSKQAIRTVFERLAHSSIMRLNGTSMDKLYDLMTMVFKYQICLCPRPKDILFVTLNHIDGIREFCQESSDGVSLIDNVYSLIIQNFADMSLGQFQRLRYILLTFFQDLQIRVSVLLKEGLQRTSGKFVLPRGGHVPYGCRCPGTITAYDQDGKISRIASFPTQDKYEPALPEGSLEKDGNRVTKLGRNIYLEHEDLEKMLAKASTYEGIKDHESSEAINANACDQLSFLARLIGQTGSSNQPSEFTLRVDFNEGQTDDVPYTGAPQNQNSTIINIDVSQRMEQNTLHRIMGDLTVEEKEEPEDQDILDLLDVASA